MKYQLLWVGLACLAMSITSEAKTCTYRVDHNHAKLQWTGYKFTSKVGVNGTFDLVAFKQNEKAPNIQKLFESVHFEVDAASINSGDPMRDKKLALYVFGPLKNPGKIVGTVTSYDGKSARADMMLNGRKLAVPFTVAKKDDLVVFTGEIDLLKFGMKESWQAIAEACKVLHTGPDKVSKTWSTVGLKVEAKVIETCK